MHSPPPELIKKRTNQIQSVGKPMTRNSLSQWTQQITKYISEAQNQNDLLLRAATLTKELNFELFAYEVFMATPFTRPVFYSYSNQPTKWISQYRIMNYALIDPRVHHSQAFDELLCWNVGIFESDQNLRNDAMEAGMCIGLTQPTTKNTGSIELFSVARRGIEISPEELSYLRPKIKFFAEMMEKKLSERNNQLRMSESVTLSAKEKEILRWTADGKTSEETAIILNLSVNTINFHLKNIQYKTGCANRVQTVAYSIAKGHI
jgi:DNA-binding CsgD family transcriptional regulator